MSADSDARGPTVANRGNPSGEAGLGRGSPPREVCVLRLAAIGDVCHALAVVRALQDAWPETRFTWLVGSAAAPIVVDIPEIEFLVLEKRSVLHAYGDARRLLRGRRFDLLLHMQNSWRGNLTSRAVLAPLRLGFHRDQTKDQQWLFTNRRIAAAPRAHVLDVLMGFTEACGVPRGAPRWDLPICAEAREFAARTLPGERPVLTISPCANERRRNWRNWTAAGYAAVADYAAERHGMVVVLCGGRTETEARYRDEILARARTQPLDLVGKSSLPQLLAVLERSRALVCPDSGPAHLGSALGVPVIGLYATTNPDRARPYGSARWTVNRYPDAVRRAFGCPVDEVPFGRRVRDPQAMELITVDDVTAKLDELAAGAVDERAGGGEP